MGIEIQAPLTDIAHLSLLNQARYPHARLSYDELQQAYNEYFQQLQAMARTPVYAMGFDDFVKIEDLELFYNVVTAWKPVHGPCPTLAGMLTDAQWHEGAEFTDIMKFADRLQQHIKRSAFTMAKVQEAIPVDPIAKAERAAKMNRDRVSRHRALLKGLDLDNPIDVQLSANLNAAQASLRAGQAWRKQRLAELQDVRRAAKAQAEKDYADAVVNMNWHISQAELEVSNARAQLDAHMIAKQ